MSFDCAIFSLPAPVPFRLGVDSECVDASASRAELASSGITFIGREVEGGALDAACDAILPTKNGLHLAARSKLPLPWSPMQSIHR